MSANCYKCKWRRTIPGDHHSRCKHPEIDEIGEDPVAIILAMFASVGRTQPQVSLKAISEKFQIKANPYGIKQGWFNWPWNFDPAWLENCEAFEKKNDS